MHASNAYTNQRATTDKHTERTHGRLERELGRDFSVYPGSMNSLVNTAAVSLRPRFQGTVATTPICAPVAMVIGIETQLGVPYELREVFAKLSK